MTNNLHDAIALSNADNESDEQSLLLLLFCCQLI